MFMLNINLFNIIFTFSEIEWEKLILYIKSKDAVSKRKYLPLIIELKNYRLKPHILKEIQASEIFSKIYKKNLSTQTISNRQNELLNLIKSFIKNNAFEKNELLKTDFYLGELLTRNLIDLFSKEYKKKKNIIENNYYDDNSYKTLSNIFGYRSDFLSIKNDSENSLNAYFKLSNFLLAEALSNLYKTCQILQIFKVHNIERDSPMLDFVNDKEPVNFFKELEKQNDPLFKIPLIHYYIFKSLQNPDCKKYISKAKRIYFANEKFFPESFKLHVYNMLMSYYTMKANKGDRKYFEDLFLLYKKKLKQNLVSDIKEHYAIDNNVFREYVIAGLRVNQFKWVERVIKKYSHLLPEDIRKDEYTLAMIRLYFSKKEYGKVIEIANTNKIKNKKHYLDSLRFALMSYYESEKYEECFPKIDNIRHYLKNNKTKILKVRTLLFKQFLDAFSKLLNYRLNPFNKDSNNIFYEFEKSGFSEREYWLYEKLKEIQEKNITF
jgi:hypothetical protein